MATDKRRCIIGTPESPARSTFMFCSTLKKSDDDPDAPATGSCGILFSKSDKKMYARVMRAFEEAGIKKLGRDFNPKSKRIKSCIRDGDELCDDSEYTVGEEARGMWFISTKCYRVPQLVDAQNQRIIDPTLVESTMKSGNYFLFSVTFKGFSNESKGVRCELNNLMFIKEGDRLDGSANAEQDFEDYAIDEDPDEWDDDDDDDDDDRKSSRRRSNRGRTSKSSRFTKDRNSHNRRSRGRR